MILRGHLELVLYVLTLHFGFSPPGEGREFKAEPVVAPQERIEASQVQKVLINIPEDIR